MPDLDDPLFGSANAPAPDTDTADSYLPEHGEVVRLDDPELDGQAQYGLYVAEGLVVPLPGAQSYQLPVYPAG
jgi:hypothetical protein